MLVRAIRKGRTEISKALLRKGANVDPEHNFGISPLCEAIVRDQVEIVHILRLRGADPTKRCQLRHTPLLQAVIRGNEVIFIHLIRNMESNADASVPKKYGTFLNAAAYGGNLSLVRGLTKICGPTQYKDSEGRNPAHFAARGGHADVLKFFLDNGIDPQALDITGRGIVHHAACGGSIETLRVALEAQPLDVKFTENTWSPLHWACKRGSVELINLLLEYGVKESTVKTTDEPAAEWTPFRLAVYHQNKSLVRNWSETKYKMDNTIVLQGYHSISLAGCSWCLHVRIPHRNFCWLQSLIKGFRNYTGRVIIGPAEMGWCSVLCANILQTRPIQALSGNLSPVPSYGQQTSTKVQNGKHQRLGVSIKN